MAEESGDDERVGDIDAKGAFSSSIHAPETDNNLFGERTQELDDDEEVHSLSSAKSLDDTENECEDVDALQDAKFGNIDRLPQENNGESSAPSETAENLAEHVGDGDDEPDDAEFQSDNNSEKDIYDTEEAEIVGPSKSRRVMLSSDEDDDRAPSPKRGRESGSDNDHVDDDAEVGQLMTNIFGEESDEEKEDVEEREKLNNKSGDEDEPKYLRDEPEEYGNVWDFDVMLNEKKTERRKYRRRRHDGSIDVGGNYDEQIRTMIDAMKAAAKDDRHSNKDRKPAVKKLKLLPAVKSMLIKHDLMEAVIDNGMMNVISEWLAPLPDKSLPALEIRTDILKILQDYNRLEPGTLKQSGLGRAVMLLFKHPREIKANKAIAARLISDWARPIFQLDADYHSMSKDERVQRDYAQLPEAKRQRMSRSSEGGDSEKETETRPGDRGFIIRARVPHISQKDYVVRPKSSVEGNFRGATKNRSNSRYDRTQREFKERTRKQRVQRAVAVSINRVNI